MLRGAALSGEQIVQQPEWFRHLFGPVKVFFADRLHSMQDDFQSAVNDGLTQIIPVLLAQGSDVSNTRQTLGKATWRKIHHASEHTNFMRSLVWLRFRTEADWHVIVNLQDDHLRSCRNAVDWQVAQYAGTYATQGRFAQTAMLYCDTVKLGGRPDCTWPLERLKREYAKRNVRNTIACADPAPWADPFSYEQNGFQFQQLISDREFVVEGNVMRHCVASYREDARTGAVYVLRCTGAERATVRFDRSGGFEISSFANGPVTQMCKTTARAAMRCFLVTHQKP